MLFNPPTPANDTVHLTAASDVFVRSQGLGTFSKQSQNRELGTVRGFETTNASAAPGWLSAERSFPLSIGFLAGRLKSLGTELHSLFNLVRCAAPGWLSARVPVNFSKHSQLRALGTAHGFDLTDAAAAPGWLSARHPSAIFPEFLAGRMKSLGTELHSLFNPVRVAAPGWLSARVPVNFSKHSQLRALGTAHGFDLTDAAAAPGWLSARHPSAIFPEFLAGRMKSLGTELHSLFNPVRVAAPGWLSARVPVNFSKRSQNPALGTAQGFALSDVEAAPGWLSASASEDFSPEGYHLPVLFEEVVENMAAGPGKFIIDGTLGGGGHSELLLKTGAEVLGVDRDPEALAHATERLAGFGARFSTFQANFSEIPTWPGIQEGKLADGLLLDLGVSSRQLDSAPRGFSFMREGPLDMRMGPNATMTAADLVNGWSESEIARIIYTFGEERRSRRIAEAIVKQRQEKPFETTLELASCIEKAIGRSGRTHPATKSFQAIRMAINEELESLSSILSSASKILKPGGRLLIITFHSLEDRMVKRFLRHHSQPYIDDPTWPEPRPNPDFQFRLLSKKAIAPSAQETSTNPRARSAKLRVAQLLSLDTEL